MNLFRISPFMPFVACGALLSGCASKSHKPSETAPVAATQANAEPRRPQFKLDDILAQAAAKAHAPFEGEGWQPMFDGKTLAGWRETDFAGRGEIQCQNDLIVLNTGDPFTGINYTNTFPKMNYELALDAMRVTGSDFFCGLTVPVGTNCCSLIVGGWGGTLVGISSLDSMDASENETTKFMNFNQDQWYRIRLRVTEARIEAWIDKEKIVDVTTAGRRVSVRPGDIELSRPMGVAAWQTTAALRQPQWRSVTGPADPPKRDQ
jgi:hypothetical protein